MSMYLKIASQIWTYILGLRRQSQGQCLYIFQSSVLRFYGLHLIKHFKLYEVGCNYILGCQPRFSVPFHRLWLSWQQIGGIAADRVSYLRKVIQIYMYAEKGVAQSWLLGNNRHFYLFLHHRPWPEFIQLHWSCRYMVVSSTQKPEFSMCASHLCAGTNQFVAWSVCLFCLIHVSRDISMAIGKECSEECFSAPTLTLMGRKRVGAGYLHKENNHQQAPTVGPQNMLSFTLYCCAEVLSQGQSVLGQVPCNTSIFLEAFRPLSPQDTQSQLYCRRVCETL